MGSPAWLDRPIGPWRRLPHGLRIGIIAAVVFAAAFSLTILPLILQGHAAARAEVAGRLPETARVDQQMSFDVALDNTGGEAIQPVCVRIRADRPVRLDGAVFQGLDHVGARGDEFCGGTLSGSETVSVGVQLTFTAPGPATVKLVATEGSRVVGPVKTAHVLITS